MCVTLILVTTRNITLNLPTDLIRQAKVYSAENDISVNAFVRELLEEALSRRSRTRVAVKRLLALAEKVSSDVDPGSIRREDLYERV